MDNDVVFLKAALNNYSFKDENIIVLRDSKATCEGIWRVLDSLLTVTKKGDVVQIHFSAHGQRMTDDNGDEEDGLDEAIVCYDTPMRLKEGYDGSKHIRDDQLMIMINHIRKKAGRFGQVILSMDVAHSGPDDAEVIKSGNRVLKTRGGFFEITSNLEMAPVVVFSACLSSQLNFEVRVPGLYGQDTVPVGAWTYSFYVVSGKHWVIFFERPICLFPPP